MTTLKISLPVLIMLLSYTLLGTVVVAAIIFQFEQGEFQVTLDYPHGAYLRPSLTMHGGMEISPFTSIWASLYWSVVTATTLGYGDLYPTTPIGRSLACVWIFCGIVIVAMPVGVLGSNFSMMYQTFKEKEREEMEAAALISSRDQSSTSSHSLSLLAQKRKPLRIFPKVSLKYFHERKRKIHPTKVIAEDLPDPVPAAPSPLPLASPSSVDAGQMEGSKDGIVTSDEGGRSAEQEGGQDEDDIIIKRQTLKDLFQLIQRLNRNKSEGSVLERQLSEITLSLKKQTEEEREPSRRGHSCR
jgi:hypothetical protein